MELAELIVNTHENFVALAEYIGDGFGLLRLLWARGVDFYQVPSIGCERISIFTDLKPSAVNHRREADRYTIKEIHIAGRRPLLVGLVHLPSKLHTADDDQLYSAMFFKVEIEAAEAEAGHKNTIIFGDFNMNPFDKGMVSAAALNSLPSLMTAKRESRVFQGRECSFFYNPSWILLGDLDDTPGTYYHNAPSHLSHYWNTLDQVIVRPAIADGFQKASLKILKSTGATSLVSRSGKPSVSDHLPIFFCLDIP
jgi:endonuclease/exonuclease/phosphatase family metal-dependent hydrolase